MFRKDFLDSDANGYRNNQDKTHNEPEEIYDRDLAKECRPGFMKTFRELAVKTWKDKKLRTVLILSIIFFKVVISVTVIFLVSEKAN
jgi:hypothetical protein